MIVAIEQGLLKFETALKRAGHRVVPLFSYCGEVDAILYKNMHISQLPQALMGTGALGGVFLICAKNREPKEVLFMLKTKQYGAQGLFS